MNIHLEKIIIFNHGKVFFSTPGNNYYHPYVWFGLPCTKNNLNQKYICISVKNIWPCWMLKLLNRMQYFIHRRDSNKTLLFSSSFLKYFFVNALIISLYFFFTFSSKAKLCLSARFLYYVWINLEKKIQKIWNSMQFKTVFYFNFYLLVYVHCK